MSRKRWPMLAGLLAAGAALGAAGALVMRRRRQQWEEYDPTQAIEPTQADFGTTSSSPADPAGFDELTPEPADQRP